MSSQEAQGWFNVMWVMGGALFGTFGTWVLMRRDIADLKEWKANEAKAEEAARLERERQQSAWWDRIGEIKKALADLDRACSNATVELRTKIAGLEHRVDTHSGSNVANLAGIVRNYNDMLVQTLDTLKEALRQAAKGNAA